VKQTLAVNAQSFQFSRAVLCLSCNSVSDTQTDTCPGCACKGLMNVSRAFAAATHRCKYDSGVGAQETCGRLRLWCSCGEFRDVRSAR
jgi:hypothetical protein